MSERKSAEIKFRIEPSVKAFWQEQAAVETEGNLSELITAAVNQHVHWAKENARLEGTKLVGSALVLLEAPQLDEALEEREHELSADCWCGPKVVTIPEVPEGVALLVDQPKEEYLSEWTVQVQPVPLGTAAEMSPQLSDEVERKSWMFEGRNG